MLTGFAIAGFFSPVVRAVAKNFPMIIIKSHRSGKSQGKSTAAESILWATSNPDTNRLQNYVKTEQINKLASVSGTLLAIEDVKSATHLASLAISAYDRAHVTNKTGDTLPFAELCATANDVFANECVNDRQCFVSFDNWGEMSAEEIATRTERHEKLISSDEKMFPWLLANFSEFFAGGEFKENLKIATRESYERYEFLKIRTCRNYSIGEVTVRHLYSLMSDTFLELGHPIEEFDEYLKTTVTADLKRSHVEFDNERSVIRRWVSGVLDVMESWEQPRRMQTMKVLKSNKLSSVNKWAIAIVPSEEFAVLNCISVKKVEADVKQMGGLMYSAQLLKDDCEDESFTVGRNAVTRWALLIPLSCLRSSTVCKICQFTNQLELQQLVDFETPSGFSDAPASQKTVLESTRTSSSSQSLRLELSEITASTSTPSASRTTPEARNESVRRVPFQTLVDELVLAEITAIDEDLKDMDDDEDDDLGSFIDDEGTGAEDWTAEDIVEEIPGGTSEDFDDLSKSSSLSSSFKSKRGNNTSQDTNVTTISLGDTSALLCNVCKGAFRNKSGFSRHACKPSTSKTALNLTILKCTDDVCTRIFTNNSALTRHLKVHDASSNTSRAAPDQVLKCGKCSATYKTEIYLKKHEEAKHRETVEEESSAKFQCTDCPSTYVKEFNLKKHVVSKHQEVLEKETVDNVSNIPENSSKTTSKDTDEMDNANGNTGKNNDLVEGFACGKCDSKYIKEFNLKKHIEAKHGVINAQPIRRRRSIETHKSKASAKSKRI